MKTKLKTWVAIALITLVMAGCKQTNYITEYYIKNMVEKHVPGNQSTIKCYSIYQGTSQTNKNASSYIEFTGVKYQDMKKMIIGTDIRSVSHSMLKSGAVVTSEPTYLILDLSECISIIANYNLLIDAIKPEHPLPSEEIYHDYTASSDLFISFRKSIGHPNANTIDVWVAEKKFTVKTKKFIKKLKRFIDY